MSFNIMPIQAKRYGSFILAIISGLLLLIILGGSPSAFWLLFAGVAAGMIARGVVRGTISAAIAGIIIVIILSLITTLKDGYPVYTAIHNDLGFSYFVDSILSSFANLYSLGQANISKLLYVLVIDAVLIPGVGGFIGGALRPGY